jgi:glycosyltransferase involved in cell wall biosynthesis
VTETLSVVMPVYNEAAHLPATLAALGAALDRCNFEAEVVLVDDGSTDGSVGAARAALQEWLPLRVISQPNSGRIDARRAGLEAASAEWVLLLDARVRLRPDALAFAYARVRAGERVWTGHVHIHTSGNPYGTFMNVLTEIAWRDYFDCPRTVSFGSQDFDRYPKGSGCFIAPRDLLRAAYSRLPTRYADRRHANDDTPMLRSIAAAEPIHVSPSFASDYIPRGSLATFVKHSVHRGVVFLDGHGRAESRFFPFAVAFFPSSLALATASLLRPRVLPAALVAASVAAATAAVAARRSRFEILSTAALAPVWAAAFGAGLWRGLGMAASRRVRERRRSA